MCATLEGPQRCVGERSGGSLSSDLSGGSNAAAVVAVLARLLASLVRGLAAAVPLWDAAVAAAAAPPSTASPQAAPTTALGLEGQWALLERCT